MNRFAYVKVLAFVGSVITAAISALQGDYVTAIGIVVASLSSANLRVPTPIPVEVAPNAERG